MIHDAPEIELESEVISLSWKKSFVKLVMCTALVGLGLWLMGLQPGLDRQGELELAAKATIAGWLSLGLACVGAAFPLARHACGLQLLVGRDRLQLRSGGHVVGNLPLDNIADIDLVLHGASHAIALNLADRHRGDTFWMGGKAGRWLRKAQTGFEIVICYDWCLPQEEVLQRILQQLNGRSTRTALA